MLIVFKNMSTRIETSKLGLIHKVNNKRRRQNIHTFTSLAEILTYRCFSSQRNYYSTVLYLIHIKFQLILQCSYLDLVILGGKEKKRKRERKTK